MTPPNGPHLSKALENFCRKEALGLPDYMPSDWDAAVDTVPGGGVGCQGIGCENPCTWEVYAHALNDCQSDTTNLDQDGNFSWYACSICFTIWIDHLNAVIYRLRANLPVPCRTCQRPISDMSDIILWAKKIDSP